MRHSLHSHILYLENKVQLLKDRLTNLRLTIEEGEDLEKQLALAELALARYREAYALELAVSCSEPPGRPGSQSQSGNGASQPRNGEKKREGLTAFAARQREFCTRYGQGVSGSRGKSRPYAGPSPAPRSSRRSSRNQQAIG